MSTTTAAVAEAAPAADLAEETLMYWCHSCDMSISLPPLSSSSSSSLLCPHCTENCLEEIDSSPLFDSSSPSSGPDPSLAHLISLFDPSYPLISPHNQALINTNDDNFLLDSPYLRRLIHHLTDPDPDPDDSSPYGRKQSPASKSAVQSIPTVKISDQSLELDSVVMCAVCKDQFSIGDEAKQLPCKHMYHSDCILPWLSQHNSCPVCRFHLPTEKDAAKEKRREGGGFQSMSFDELLMQENELRGLGNSLRYISRRNRLASPEWSRDNVLRSLSQVHESDANPMDGSNDTVSSCPVDGGSNGPNGGGGDGDGDGAGQQ